MSVNEFKQKRRHTEVSVFSFIVIVVASLLLGILCVKAVAEDKTELREGASKTRNVGDDEITDKRSDTEDKLRKDVLRTVFKEKDIEDIGDILNRPWSGDSVDFLWNLTFWGRGDQAGRGTTDITSNYGFYPLMVYLTGEYSDNIAVLTAVKEWFEVLFTTALDEEYLSEHLNHSTNSGVGSAIAAVRDYGDASFLTPAFWKIVEAGSTGAILTVGALGDKECLDRLKQYLEFPPWQFDAEGLLIGPFGGKGRPDAKHYLIHSLKSSILKIEELLEYPILREFPWRTRGSLLSSRDFDRCDTDKKRNDWLKMKHDMYLRDLQYDIKYPALKDLLSPQARGFLFRRMEKEPPEAREEWLTIRIRLLEEFKGVSGPNRYGPIKEMDKLPPAEREQWARERFKLVLEFETIVKEYDSRIDSLPRDWAYDLVRRVSAVPEAERRDWLKSRYEDRVLLWDKKYSEWVMAINRAHIRGEGRRKFINIINDYMAVPAGERDEWVRIKIEEITAETEKINGQED